LAPPSDARTRKYLEKALVGLVVGAATGAIIGFYLIGEIAGVVTSGAGGAFIGWTIAERIMSWTGWFVLSGAICGGLVGLLATGLGKGALYGIPIGSVAGLLLGMSLEAVMKKRLH